MEPNAICSHLFMAKSGRQVSPSSLSESLKLEQHFTAIQKHFASAAWASDFPGLGLGKSVRSVPSACLPLPFLNPP